MASSVKIPHHIRSTADQHVMTIGSNKLPHLRRKASAISSFRDLATLITVSSPLADKYDPFEESDSLPSATLIKATDPNLLAQTQSRYSLSTRDAAAKLIRSGQTVRPDAAFLATVPPDHIHSMQRGPHWVGDWYSADMVAAALKSVGIEIQNDEAFLDYGCSSGAMLRILAWAYPSAKFYGTDPVAPSIEWASVNLGARSNLEFHHQDQLPPLPFADASFDYTAAVSVFSHHGINASKIWFSELCRVLKPGGHLVFTTHGVGAMLHYTKSEIKPVVRYAELYQAFLEEGYVFEEVWLGTDDIGNVATEQEWGNSFYDPKVIADLLADKFEVLSVGLRTNQHNQDIYVARKL